MNQPMPDQTEMRIGLAIGRMQDIPRGAPEIIEQIRRAEHDGFASVWVSHLLLVEGYDGPTIVAAAAQVTTRIELATFVPFLTRHPASMAHQALTIQALSENRLILCMASSHRVFMEHGLGIDFGDPVALLADYLPVLDALFRQGPVRRLASPYRTRVVPDVPGAKPPFVILPGLRRSMVRLAGGLADGVATIMAGPRFLEREVVPVLRHAAGASGRQAPRVAAHFFVSLTTEIEEARRYANGMMADLHEHPMYQRVLKVDGVERVGDVSIIGDPDMVADRLDGLASIGVTDLMASIPVLDGDVAAYERTYRFLADRALLASGAAIPRARLGQRGEGERDGRGDAAPILP